METLARFMCKVQLQIFYPPTKLPAFGFQTSNWLLVPKFVPKKGRRWSSRHLRPITRPGCGNLAMCRRPLLRDGCKCEGHADVALWIAGLFYLTTRIGMA